MNRVYYLMQLVLTSPLSVGSGEKKYTDHDIILDSLERPMIPATAIAGVFRHYIGDDCSELFGSIKSDETEDGEPSHVIFYDACETKRTFTTIRDCVSMNDGEKTAKDNHKFELQAEETDAVFEAVIELDETGCGYTGKIEDAIAALNSGIIRFGAKTSRGYGAVRVDALYKAEFTSSEDIDRWLDFDMFSCGDKNYKKIDCAEYSGDSFTRIVLELSQKGGISIREYSTERQQNNSDGSGTGDSKKGANYKHISLSNGVPVIPGTSWAGAFRSRYSEFAGTGACNSLFGFADDKSGESRASRITFSESQISGYTPKVITRNAIDRYSGGVKDSALFTEHAVFNGKCTLEIDVKEITDKELAALCAVIIDLDRGYLAIGGLTSVGRGLFTADKMTVNGGNVTQALKSADIASIIGRAAHGRV